MRDKIISLITILILSIPVIVVLKDTPPFRETVEVPPDNAFENIESDLIMGQTFVANDNGLREIRVLMNKERFADEKTFEFTVFDKTAKTEIKKENFTVKSLKKSYLKDYGYYVFHDFYFPAISDSLNKEYVFYIKDVDLQSQDPISVRGSLDDTYPQGTRLINNKEASGDITFKLYYETKTDYYKPWLAYFFLLLIVLTVLGHKIKDFHLALIAAIVLALLASYFRWVTNFEYCHCEYIPDGFGGFAEQMYKVVSNCSDENLQALQATMHNFAHAHNPLVSILTAGTMLVFKNVTVSYLLTSILLGLLTILVFNKILREQIKIVDGKLVYLFNLLLISNVIFLRAFSRPLTDSGGVFFTLLALYLIGRYLEQKRRSILYLVGLVSVLALETRIALLPLLALPVLSSIVSDFPRRKWGTWLKEGLITAVAPLAIFLGLNFMAGSFVTIFMAADATAKEMFRYFNSLKFFRNAMIASGQIYLPLAFFNRKIKNLPYLIHALWFILYIGFLVLIRATFWNRYFLPIVPSIIILAIPVIQTLHNKKPALTELGLYLLTAGNLLATFSQIFDWPIPFIPALL